MQHLNKRRALLISALCTPLVSFAAEDTQEPLEIGILPNISARSLLAQYEPMRRFLERVLNRKVQMSTAQSWEVFHQRTLDKEYDVVITAVHLGRVAEVDSGYRPLLIYKPYIKGLIAYANKTPITSITAIRNQTIVLSNPKSLVTIKGMEWLAEKNLRPERDFKTIDTPTDDSVGNVIVRGDAIAAMLSSGEYRAIPDQIKSQISLLTSFGEVPGFLVMTSPKVTKSKSDEFKKRMVEFADSSEEGKQFFAGTGFTAIAEIPPGVLESMDAYLARTRDSLVIKKK
jgi:phosphonate transport system substrate-binding protein